MDASGGVFLEGQQAVDKTVQTSRRPPRAPGRLQKTKEVAGGRRASAERPGPGCPGPGGPGRGALLQCVLELAAGLLQDGAAARGPGLPVARLHPGLGSSAEAGGQGRQGQGSRSCRGPGTAGRSHCRARPRAAIGWSSGQAAAALRPSSRAGAQRVAEPWPRSWSGGRPDPVAPARHCSCAGPASRLPAALRRCRFSQAARGSRLVSRLSATLSTASCRREASGTQLGERIARQVQPPSRPRQSPQAAQAYQSQAPQLEHSKMDSGQTRPSALSWGVTCTPSASSRLLARVTMRPSGSGGPGVRQLRCRCRWRSAGCSPHRSPSTPRPGPGLDTSPTPSPSGPAGPQGETIEQ